MTPTFFKFRHDKIKEWMRMIPPTLIGEWLGGGKKRWGNRGHIRYSLSWYDHNSVNVDFLRQWIGDNHHFKTYYDRIAFMKNLRHRRKLTEWMIKDMFGETPYGQMLEGFRKP